MRVKTPAELGTHRYPDTHDADQRPRSGLTPPHTRRCGRNLMTATTTRERWICSGQIGKTVARASSTLSLGLEQWPSRMAALWVGAAVAASSLLGTHSGSARLALSAPLHTFPLSAAGPSTNTSPYRTTQPPLMAWYNSIPASSSDTGTFASDQRWLALVVYWVQFTFRTPPHPLPIQPTPQRKHMAVHELPPTIRYAVMHLQRPLELKCRELEK